MYLPKHVNTCGIELPCGRVEFNVIVDHLSQQEEESAGDVRVANQSTIISCPPGQLHQHTAKISVTNLITNL